MKDASRQEQYDKEDKRKKKILIALVKSTRSTSFPWPYPIRAILSLSICICVKRGYRGVDGQRVCWVGRGREWVLSQRDLCSFYRSRWGRAVHDVWTQGEQSSWCGDHFVLWCGRDQLKQLHNIYSVHLDWSNNYSRHGDFRIAYRHAPLPLIDVIGTISGG